MANLNCALSFVPWKLHYDQRKLISIGCGHSLRHEYQILIKVCSFMLFFFPTWGMVFSQVRDFKHLSDTITIRVNLNCIRINDDVDNDKDEADEVYLAVFSKKSIDLPNFTNRFDFRFVKNGVPVDIYSHQQEGKSNKSFKPFPGEKISKDTFYLFGIALIEDDGFMDANDFLGSCLFYLENKFGYILVHWLKDSGAYSTIDGEINNLGERAEFFFEGHDAKYIVTITVRRE